MFHKKNNPNKKLKIVFMGTSDLAGIVLQSLLDKDYLIDTVVTQPDYTDKRKKNIIGSPVKETALKNKLTKIRQPEKLDEEFIKEIKNIQPDLIIVVAYGKILPEKLLNIPKFKSINVHASLLPKLRGPSPIQNALLLGLKKTGITIMLMDKGIDTGDILAQKKLSVKTSDDYLTLTSKLAVLSSNLLLKTLPKWVSGKIKPKKQNEKRATMCQLIERADGRIIWDDNAVEIFNKFRAFRAWPGIFTFWERKGNQHKISLTDISYNQKIFFKEKRHLGEVFQLKDGEVAIQTGKGIIIINRLQLAGKREIDVKNFLNGYPDFIGSILR